MHSKYIKNKRIVHITNSLMLLVFLRLFPLVLILKQEMLRNSSCHQNKCINKLSCYVLHQKTIILKISYYYIFSFSLESEK